MESLWHKVSENGYLVFVEQGSPRGFRFVHDLRKWLINKGNCDIIAPCPHMFKCPLSDGKNWCHFGQRYNQYPKTVIPKIPVQRAAGVEKFCYLIVKKTKIEKDIEKTETLEEKSLFWDRFY